uniref:NADH-ubiquinone oxidoreductase chain 5 n=1 Tax=Ramalina intermedia TaxID=86788 RepID=A0A5B8HPJ8_9LECA|nr:NADH dehydrogenase subunit 5 [Ramalina intermedia]QDX14936.1 NADH dehydrogenase subunit 5 [Ramalina intermedia]
MYLAIIVLPLLGSIVSGFFGRKVGVSGAQLIACLCVVTTTFMAILAFVEVALNSIPVYLSLFRWIDSESINVLWAFNFDSLTVSMLIPVLIISSLVHIYSIGYMGHDPHNQRFFSYLSLFTFMMIILVTANSFLLMFVGWEGVGVCSYLLVSFWFTRIAANQSSMSAFLTNRVGDCFLTLGMFVIIRTFGNLDYSVVFSLAPFVNENTIAVVGICLLIGAMAKSSQIGLHIWLPLAMEGPTPVSALIHAATMVTAGVYLLMRSSPLIEYSTTVLLICLWIGSITTVFSSLIGLFQQDIKKVIAYSTMSQLGMMVIAVGLSSYNIALFHLVNHAFYKGLLFLGAGAVIHAVADNQDFRKYGALLTFLPLTYTVMLIASLSLVAFPFMTGFYSKDLILETSFGLFKYSSFAVYFIAVIGAVFTTLYSVKVLYLTFITNPNGSLVSYKNAHEGDIFMSLPLVILALFSISFGFFTSDIFKGLGSTPFADNSLFIHPSHEIMLNTEFGVTTIFKLLPFMLTIVSILISTYLLEILPRFLIYFKSSRFGYNLFNFFSLRFLVEFIYNRLIVRSTLSLGGQTTKLLDKGSVELVGPYGIEKRLLKLSDKLNKLDTGIITSYALYILIGLILYMSLPYVFYYNFSLLLLVIYGLYTITEDK